MLQPSPYQLITTDTEARARLNSLRQASLVGLDTETYFDPQAKRMKLSLLQIAYGDDPVIILDTRAIDIECARELIESPGVEMAAHNARFDYGVLADAGFAPRGFIDTLPLARRALRLNSYTLAAVAAELFGESLDKRLQKSDWRKRPLSDEQLIYAAQDAKLTLRVYQELRRRLELTGKLDEALSAARINPQTNGEHRTRTRRATRLELPPLNRADQLLLKKLKHWRLDYARANHTPAYMICPDKTLEHLAQTKPATLDELKNIYGLGESKVTRFGAELLDALSTAVGEQPGESVQGDASENSDKNEKPDES